MTERTVSGEKREPPRPASCKFSACEQKETGRLPCSTGVETIGLARHPLSEQVEQIRRDRDGLLRRPGPVDPYRTFPALCTPTSDDVMNLGTDAVLQLARPPEGKDLSRWVATVAVPTYRQSLQRMVHDTFPPFLSIKRQNNSSQQDYRLEDTQLDRQSGHECPSREEEDYHDPTCLQSPTVSSETNGPVVE